MSRPVLFDACCGEGGATRGYQLAGFYVVGADINPQPRYVGDEFIQGDALALIRDPRFMARFAAIHASWPCQHFLEGTLRSAEPTADLVTPGREAMNATGLPWVIENVMRAPLDRDRSIVLCANTFGLRAYRHRRFEYSKHLELKAPPHLPHVKRVANSRRRERWLAGDHASITGDIGTYAGPEAMGIDWMTGDGLSEAIPPAYTSWVGRQLIAHLVTTTASAGHPLAICPHCLGPVASPLADCEKPECQRADAELEAAWKRLEDR